MNNPIEETKTVSRQETPTGSVVQETVAVKGNDYEFAVNKVSNVIWAFIGIINLLIVLRFFFLLFGANRVGFVSFIYDLTDVFVAPFKGIFEAAANGDSFFDTASLLAIVMWSVIGLIVTTLVKLFSARDAQ